ncbi:MAG TPA: hypothetical protein VMH41_13720 [Mycobacteriales bacterium]|nr:hypothetical protein [Mycobacteriales bacterium]
MTKTRQWTIFTAVAVVIVLAAGWFLMVKPQQSKTSNLKGQASDQQAANAQLMQQIAALQQEETNLPAQQRALQKFNTQVPDNAAEPTIIRQLSAAANASGIDLVAITPGTASAVNSAATTTGSTGSTSLSGTTAPAGSLVALPLSLGITGTYANIEDFFLSLERLPRALLVTDWSLCPDSASANSSAPSGGTGGATCTPPPAIANKTLPDGTLGGTLTATVFYSPPGGVASAQTTLPGTTTTPSTAATPSTTGTTPSTAATPTTAATAAAS